MFVVLSYVKERAVDLLRSMLGAEQCKPPLSCGGKDNSIELSRLMGWQELSSQGCHCGRYRPALLVGVTRRGATYMSSSANTCNWGGGDQVTYRTFCSLA